MAPQVEESVIDAGMMQEIVRADGYIWLKYGQKHVHDTYITRCYYRCSCSRSQSSCTAKKTVEYDRRRDYMLSTIHINYSSPHHNHPPPLEKRICEEPSCPLAVRMHPDAEAPKKQTRIHPPQERHKYDNASPAAAPPEPSATESCCSVSCAVNANLHSVSDPHSVQHHHHDAPTLLAPPATPAAISASSAAAAPEHAAGPSTVSKEFFQQFLAPANNEDGEDDSQTASDAAGVCSSNCGSSSEGAPIGEAPSIQLFGSSILLDESSATLSIQNREYSEWSDGGLLDDTPCAKRARRTESAPARFSPSPVFVEAAGTNEEQLQFSSEFLPTSIFLSCLCTSLMKTLPL
ncbi:unnamed protein product [Closterium sp. NIES-65]|nr:unnamed protein product [Closterium sp. NIES-65]